MLSLRHLSMVGMRAGWIFWITPLRQALVGALVLQTVWDNCWRKAETFNT
jgi:hypothetical protein